MSASISRVEAGHELILTARGALVRDAAQDVAAQIEHLDPDVFPILTLDLRDATAFEPLIVHALFRAWERRSGAEPHGHGPEGGVRILVTPGPVQRFLDSLRLERAFEVIHHEREEHEVPAFPVVESGDLRAVQAASIEHWHHLLAAARRHELAEFTRSAREAHPICVAAGAPAGGPAAGEWCEACPLHARYGGCNALIEHAVRAADAGNWDAAQLLVLSLIAEGAGMSFTHPKPEPPGRTGSGRQ